MIESGVPAEAERLERADVEGTECSDPLEPAVTNVGRAGEGGEVGEVGEVGEGGEGGGELGNRPGGAPLTTFKPEVLRPLFLRGPHTASAKAEPHERRSRRARNAARASAW